MKKFILFLMSIIMIAYLITFGIQFLSDKGLKEQKNSIYADWNAILEGEVNAVIVINGSSRAKFSYDTRSILKETKLKTQNLGFNAGGYNLQKSKFEIYLKNNRFPKVIIQNIDLANFKESKVLPDEDQFFPFINNPEINKLISKFDHKFSYVGYFPLLKYNQNFSILKTGLVENVSNQLPAESLCFGFSPKKQSFKLDLHNFDKLKSDVEEKEKVNARNQARLNEMIRFYQTKMNKNTLLVFVWAPEYKERLNIIYDPLRNPLIKQLKAIQEKNKNIFFIDFSHDVIAQNSDYFYDSFHLNAAGAKEFSGKLGVAIQTILRTNTKKE
ncbi:hypothetical protein GON26_09100 [Flavobacterium sp. GA093]|uniref:SGNH/GDSL hydrolase family protein n=1 Tax=Flavobacterium hydrocarbonoxydans TaxID=2683249 RepID=A0A6I4NJ74_9FLAO|nr:SGNH/GDSL hydrolase family protein [Flavobacterium hydrocarbonoxydans]MWB94520.1 hypothetical protein [Flavobacterium hydrocarbonoxydans]